jgi:hypothetical protein
MEINATIIVQALHFFIAYFLLKKLFFVPVVRIVLRDREIEQQILDRNAAYRVTIGQIQQQSAQQWAERQQGILQRVPPATHRVLYTGVPSKPAIIPPKIDQKYEQRLEQELAHTITSMVNHVH